jgi:hypothetical protein
MYLELFRNFNPLDFLYHTTRELEGVSSLSARADAQMRGRERRWRVCVFFFFPVRVLVDPEDISRGSMEYSDDVPTCSREKKGERGTEIVEEL